MLVFLVWHWLGSN